MCGRIVNPLFSPFRAKIQTDWLPTLSFYFNLAVCQLFRIVIFTIWRTVETRIPCFLHPQRMHHHAPNEEKRTDQHCRPMHVTLFPDIREWFAIIPRVPEENIHVNEGRRSIPSFRGWPLGISMKFDNSALIL